MTLRQRGNSWQLNFVDPDGNRKQISFKTKDEALREIKRREALGNSLDISIDDQRRYAVAEQRLQASGTTLEEAIEYFLANSAPIREEVSLIEMVERCLEAKWEEGKRDKYVKQLKSSLRTLVAAGNPQRMAHTVARPEVETWLRGNGWERKTQNNYLGDAKTVFEWGRENGMVAANPCVGIKKLKLEEREIEVLSVTQSARLLIRCIRPAKQGQFEGEDFSMLIGYLVIGLFGGIRPDEMKRLKWSDLNVDEATVKVLSTTAKTRRRRVVDLSENAIAWLNAGNWKAAAESERFIFPEKFRRRWERLRRSVGFSVRLKGESVEKELRGPHWPFDGLRHTYASMHYAFHQNESLLKAQMGHYKDSEVLFQNYRALVTSKDAEKFWALLPD